ncbi:hypothetical protein Nepgr_006604 [Nepenthes gracilis]|uniref:Uncharacterized protein n=1 Tax=Nepenthes gracilis TaxID=150966 RepID=A0AAD3S5P9_NEPGR|nr:hypothetical protein Nepgr_006604 [Nepenthes gracilis]
MEVGADANLLSKVRIRTGCPTLLPDQSYSEVAIAYQWMRVRCGLYKHIGHIASQCNSTKVYRPTGRILTESNPSSSHGRDSQIPSFVFPEKNISGTNDLPSSLRGAGEFGALEGCPVYGTNGYCCCFAKHTTESHFIVLMCSFGYVASPRPTCKYSQDAPDQVEEAVEDEEDFSDPMLIALKILLEANATLIYLESLTSEGWQTVHDFQEKSLLAVTDEDGVLQVSTPPPLAQDGTWKKAKSRRH